MEYPGYKNKEEIYALVQEVFPYIEKPNDKELVIYSIGNSIPDYIADHMQAYSSPKLVIDGVRYLRSELKYLTPKGFAWLLPSLIRESILRDGPTDDDLTTCIINDLENADINEIKLRYSSLSKKQLNCIAAYIEYLSEIHGHISSTSLEVLYGIYV